MIRKKGLAVVLALSPLGAQADITNATLYPSHAELTWQEALEVQSGTGTIEIDDLPVSLMERGLQVELAGIAGATIQQVQVDQVEQVEFVAEQTRRLLEELEDTEGRIQAHEDNIRAWQQQVTLMTRSAEKPGEQSASELNDMAQTVKDTTRQALTQIREIRKAMSGDVAQRDLLKRELAGVKDNARASKRVRLRYQAPESGDLTATLRFQTPAARWRSEYNARLATELEDRPGGELTLEHLAVVSQTTGTDWEGVELRLATANTRRGAAMPNISPWIVRAGEPVAYSRAAKASADLMMESAAPSGAAVVERQSSFTQKYRISEPVTIPSGTSGQRLIVNAYDIPVEVATWMAPVLDPTGYVHATGTFNAEAPVPGGPVTLFRDGQSIGQATLQALADGEELTLGFGVDQGVRVKVVNELERTGEEGVWKSENVQRRQNRFEITNHHRGAIQIKVFDRLPVSQQDDMTVEPLEISEPVQREADDKKGVLTWERVVPAEETLSLQSGFEIRVPEGKELPRL